MTTFSAPSIPLPFDPAMRSLVRLAAAAAGGTESVIRASVATAVRDAPGVWVEEVVLQTYLFAGFPRALNTAREWRRAAGAAGLPAGGTGADETTDYARAADWRARGEETCAIVYGGSYEKLRENVRALHPALDAWMVVEGYGKVLSRPGLDLGRRELCIVAACAATQQDRQLHSHLHGAMHAQVSVGAVDATFEAIADLLPAGALESSRLLWSKVRAQY
jgi:4-carboxymuconolactone decarboxylase